MRKKLLSTLLLTTVLVAGTSGSALASSNCQSIVNNNLPNKDCLTQYINFTDFLQCGEWTPNIPNIPNIPSLPNIPSVPNLPNLPIKPPAKPENPPVKPENPGVENSSFEGQILKLVNAERAKVGAPALSLNRKLSGVANLKSKDMAQNNYFSHNSPTYGSPFEMMSSQGIQYSAAAENIASGQTSPQAVMDAWMNSSGHKANILNANFTDLGVGYAKDNSGKTYWTQMFIR